MNKLVQTLTTLVVSTVLMAGNVLAQDKNEVPKDSYNLPDRIVPHDQVRKVSPTAEVVIDLGGDWEAFLKMLAQERGSSTNLLKKLKKPDDPTAVYASSEEMCQQGPAGMILNVKYSFINKRKELVVARFDMADIIEPSTIKALEISTSSRCPFERSKKGRYDVNSFYF
jgi:hypothetical protein